MPSQPAQEATPTTSPFALLREIRQWFDGPVLLSGSLAHGSSILAAQIAGADLAYVGSAFLATHEALASDSYKDLVVASAAEDIVYSNLFTGIHGNYLRGSIEAAGLDPDQLATAEHRLTLLEKDPAEGVKAWKDIWGAGQGIGSIGRRLSTGDLVPRLRDEYQDALKAPVFTGAEHVTISTAR